MTNLTPVQASAPTLRPKTRRWAAAAVFLAAAALFPWLLGLALSPGGSGHATALNVAIMSAAFATAALGLNLIVGYCGLLNLGFAGFMLIGGYTVGILCKSAGWPFWLALPAAALHAGLWGVILGYPTLKLSGDYFAIVTFGFGELVNMTARNFTALTGGANGIQAVPRPTLWLPGMGEAFRFSLGTRAAYWWLAAALPGLALAMTNRLSRSRTGRAWRALREDEVAAEACGIAPAAYRTLAFALSAAVGGMAGGFLTAYQGYVHFQNYDFMVSISILAYVVLGGMGTVAGAVVGAVALYGLGEVLRGHPGQALAPLVRPWWPGAGEWLAAMPWAGEMRMIVYGLLLIAMVRLRPEGLLPSRSVARELHPDAPPPSTGRADDGGGGLFSLR